MGRSGRCGLVVGPFEEEPALVICTDRIGGYGVWDGVSAPLQTGRICTRRRQGAEGGEGKQVGVGDEVKQAFC